MELAVAQLIAVRIRDELAPHCDRVEIAGRNDINPIAQGFLKCQFYQGGQCTQSTRSRH